MTSDRLIALVLFLALAAFTPAIAEEPEGEPEEEAGPSAIDALLGDSERCISLNRIDRTEVVNDRTIVFYLRGGDIYVNRLPYRCPGLRSRDTFMYKNTTNSLCNVDTIRVMDSMGGTLRPGVGCGLGHFHPVSEITVEQLKAMDDRDD
jgi:hypothetical protein